MKSIHDNLLAHYIYEVDNFYTHITYYTCAYPQNRVLSTLNSAMWNKWDWKARRVVIDISLPCH